MDGSGGEESHGMVSVYLSTGINLCQGGGSRECGLRGGGMHGERGIPNDGICVSQSTRINLCQGGGSRGCGLPGGGICVLRTNLCYGDLVEVIPYWYLCLVVIKDQI